MNNEKIHSTIFSITEKLLAATRELLDIQSSLGRTEAPQSSCIRKTGSANGWMYWIWPTDIYVDGSAPNDSPCWCRILSIGGNMYEMECESFEEAISTVSQLAEFHPGGKKDPVKPFFDFELCFSPPPDTSVNDWDVEL